MGLFVSYYELRETLIDSGEGERSVPIVPRENRPRTSINQCFLRLSFMLPVRSCSCQHRTAGRPNLPANRRILRLQLLRHRHDRKSDIRISSITPYLKIKHKVLSCTQLGCHSTDLLFGEAPALNPFERTRYQQAPVSNSAFPKTVEIAVSISSFNFISLTKCKAGFRFFARV